MPKAAARAAHFEGGWGVTYEAPDGNVTVAGLGLPAIDGVDPRPEDPWPTHRFWDDGSIAGYGINGADGKNASGPDATSYVAFLAIKGQGCLYYIDTERGKRHIEYLLKNIRYVKAR
ncbi:hypothetical protein [Nonomuraea fuscirosea]|uniref:hypothetical protein n=1 Tax=Nonomuraea fuscirosea TaxID=1291556 RepID=UPI003421DACF